MSNANVDLTNNVSNDGNVYSTQDKVSSMVNLSRFQKLGPVHNTPIIEVEQNIKRVPPEFKR